LMQSPSIGIAGWYEEAMAKYPSVELEQVYRQKDPHHLAMLKAMREGRSITAVRLLNERNAIKVAETPEDIVPMLLDDYAAHRESGREVTDIALVHQGSNAELDAYNRAVQRYRLEQGEIGADQSLEVEESSTGRRWTFHAGDRIIMNEGLFTGLAEPIRNGEQGTVIRVAYDGIRVRFDNRTTVSLPLRPLAHTQPVGLGYCQSTNKYQGGQAPVVLATPGTPQIASLNSGYSQLSRMVEHVGVYLDRERWGADPSTALAKAWATPVEKTTALAFMEQTEELEDELEQWTRQALDDLHETMQAPEPVESYGMELEL
jgi:hypothetical protein